ncbi:hypothetical protein A3B21_02770 [Candidatus Uhrbacteria bacterium RIFCSPLOWO2_01_FULL_47_24]|uniref:Cohesin domain-containing protein n=1 Tax=Candidatus Uhrbacteria bacterium RIFCSPLOWO2_01_FULL_47_24 TaxID=1802401 RepID=A0A1F7UU05_9BACT|nr:MAG: hypothetical protein A2753_03815 [Candidatus Uhrbacteria bacterium RIFCSPHIGHO2_01_FULL_47_11]OGL68620.1 MAG: hypothetical protein A3D58_01795 [Candidatus Uhrbacteria bacterium RIFCSPHIGHO2_02_FULL_46_47]OGL81188.1 MAG: hypothetical protein A3B21_02770 [Candidatus Uhrbacteria bacterium RIFCSPLOWO2_01_FULL_47_24]OGL84647.1 MAG: hypothetical protein A3J03_02485 [Candidatus Uhrbacteria bacterium RIFCSPLOWO2_02_FULL_46_25]OGL93196.1 MAG: hypothetical protein A3H11_01275 [Candidatus Uhrbacte
MEAKTNKTHKKTRIATRKYTKLLVFFSLLLVPFSVVKAAPASLFLSPASGTYGLNRTFSVDIVVATPGESMNAVQGTARFDADRLEVVSLNKDGSILSLWIQEPRFSNREGTVTFEGIRLNPGYQGTAGKLLTVVFKTRALGTAKLNFSSASVLANDGKATNIITALGTAAYQIVVPELAPEEIDATEGVLRETNIISPTHSNPEKWYALRAVQFEWTLPSSIDGASFVVNQEPDTTVREKSFGRLSSYTYEVAEDGLWYFHLRLRNPKGWGLTSHFKFQVDTVAPEPFTISFIDGRETDLPQPRIFFFANDAVSGIEYYEVKVDEGSFFRVAPEELMSAPVSLPSLSPGIHTAFVYAYDRAGNVRSSAEEFSVVAPKATRSVLRIGKVQVPYFAVVAILIGFALALIFILLLAWWQFLRFRKKLKKEAHEVEEVLHKSLDRIREDAGRRSGKIKKDADDAEKAVRKEIEDIEKEVK